MDINNNKICKQNKYIFIGNFEYEIKIYISVSNLEKTG